MIFFQISQDLLFSVYLHLLVFFKNVPNEWKSGKNKEKIILLSGYGEPWTYMEAIGKHLSGQGHSVHVIPGFARNMKTILEQTKIVEEFMINKKLKNVTLVAHSKGGLVAKYLLQYSKQSTNIKKVVNIASPYGGVIWGYLKFLNLYELTPKSKILCDLNNENGCEKISNIYPKVDNVVIKKDSLKLFGSSKEIELNVVGHANILFSKELLNYLSPLLD